MDQNDIDLQGTDGSGSLGGPDVRRRIPIKLISVRSRPAPWPQRAPNRLPSKLQLGDEEGFGLKQEERVESGDSFGNKQPFLQHVFWDYKMNLIGEKDDTPVHFCDKCGLPIKMYGRMIPCKHVFCYECAMLHDKKCDSCTDPVQRIELCARGSLFMCSLVPGCKRTYLSQRDLQAHINHRHAKASKPGGGRPSGGTSDLAERSLPPPLPRPPKPHNLVPPPRQHVGPDHFSQPPPLRDEPCPAQPPPASPDLGSSRSVAPETFRITTVTTRKHSNLITVPIQDDSGSSSSHEPFAQPMPAPPAHHHHPPHTVDYPVQPVVPHPRHMMAPQQHYRTPPPLPPQLSHPMGSGPARMLYSQAPPPINPPPGHMVSQIPPYMNHPPPQHGGPPCNAPPLHRYNPGSMQQFPEDQGTLSPPFSQPGGLSPGIWPGPRGPLPPRMQGPPPQNRIPGPHHPDPSHYRTYYQ